MTQFTDDEKDLILSLLENNRNMDEFVPEEVYDSAIDKITRLFEQDAQEQ